MGLPWLRGRGGRWSVCTHSVTILNFSVVKLTKPSVYLLTFLLTSVISECTDFRTELRNWNMHTNSEQKISQTSSSGTRSLFLKIPLKPVYVTLPVVKMSHAAARTCLYSILSVGYFFCLMQEAGLWYQHIMCSLYSFWTNWPMCVKFGTIVKYAIGRHSSLIILNVLWAVITAWRILRLMKRTALDTGW
jgi:hypothetical protein